MPPGLRTLCFSATSQTVASNTLSPVHILKVLNILRISTEPTLFWRALLMLVELKIAKMWPFRNSSLSSPEEYMHLRQSSDEEASEQDYELSKSASFPKKESSAKFYGRAIAIIFSTIAVLGIGFGSGVFLESQGLLASVSITQDHPSVHSHSTCKNPPIRREWRSLSLVQKHEYVDAVLCLRKLPSSLNKNMSRYDDFPFLHTTIGEYGKLAISFLENLRRSFHAWKDSCLRCYSTYGCSILGLAPLFHSPVRKGFERRVRIYWNTYVSSTHQSTDCYDSGLTIIQILGLDSGLGKHATIPRLQC